MSEALALKYRPQDWKQVIGQDAAVRSIQAVLEKKKGRTFLFHGPSGVGKTTVARILGKHAACTEVVEINAADMTGVGDMRETALKATMYKPFNGASRIVILDECHRLTGNAFDSLLKGLEEPPDFLWWALCTTNLGKVPESVQTRCLRYGFSAVKRVVLEDLLYDIIGKEKLSFGTAEDDIVILCAKEAGGSPRKAITNLETCMAAKSYEDAQDLLKSSADVPAAIDLARLLMNIGPRTPWSQVTDLLAGMNAEAAESARHVVRDYMTKVVMNPKIKNPEKYLVILDEFSKPFHPSDGITPLVLACGKLMFGVD